MATNKEKFDILQNIDVDQAIKLFGLPLGPQAFHDITGEPVTKRQIVLVGIHKARVIQRKMFSKEEIEISINWLQDNGYKLGMKK